MVVMLEMEMGVSMMEMKMVRMIMMIIVNIIIPKLSRRCEKPTP